jgi:hypothetical protein
MYGTKAYPVSPEYLCFFGNVTAKKLPHHYSRIHIQKDSQDRPLVRPEGIEPVTCGFEVHRSMRLSTLLR